MAAAGVVRGECCPHLCPRGLQLRLCDMAGSRRHHRVG
jgi:hypothetical protein